MQNTVSSIPHLWPHALGALSQVLFTIHSLFTIVVKYLVNYLLSPKNKNVKAGINFRHPFNVKILTFGKEQWFFKLLKMVEGCVNCMWITDTAIESLRSSFFAYDTKPLPYTFHNIMQQFPLSLCANCHLTQIVVPTYIVCSCFVLFKIAEEA